MFTIFFRDYVAFTKNAITGRHQHSKFDDLVKETLDVKVTAKKVADAVQEEVNRQAEAKKEAEKKAKDASFLSRMLG